MGKFFISFFFITLWSTLGLTDDSTIHLSLSEAMQMAKERHVEVIVSEQRVQQAISRIGQARSNLLPQLQGTASQYRRVVNLAAFGIDIPNTNPLVGPFNSFDARVALTQTLFDLPTLERLKSARIGKNLSIAESEKVKQDVMALVAALYLDAKRADQAVAFARALVQQGETRDRLSRSRLQVGLGTSLDVTQKNAEIAGDRSRLTQALAQAAERRLDLIAALGLPTEEKILFSQEKFQLPSFSPESSSIDTWVDSHPDVKLATREVEQLKAERKVTKGGYFPKIVGTADYGASGIIPNESLGTYSFGGQLSIPIYQGGWREAQLKEATSRIREGEARLSDAEHTTEAKILSAQESLKQATAALQAAEADRVAAQKQLSISRSRFQTGLGTDLEVVEATTQLALIQDRHAEAEANFQLAQVNLAHAMGRLQ